jgi:putative pyoverdin transport system ATP-binding/permease protein
MSDVGRLLAFLYRQARGLISLAVVAGLLSGALAAAQVAVINSAIYHDDPRTRWFLLGAFALLLLVAPGMRLFSQYLLVKLGQDLVFDLRLRLAGRILATPLEKLERLGPAKLLAALADDTSAITDALIVVPPMASNAALFVGGLAYLGWLSPLLVTLFLMLLLPVLYVYRLPVTASFGRYRLAREEMDALYEHFTGLTAGTKELKLNRDRRSAFLGRLAGSAGKLRRLFTRANVTLAATVAGGWTFFMAAVGLAIFGAPLLGQTSREMLAGYALVLLFLRVPLEQMMGALPELGRGAVRLRKLEQLGIELRGGDAEPEAPAGDRRAAWSHLELDGVAFTFRREAGDADFVLGPIDLVFTPGELVFIIGGNGSGKTSLAKLVAGLYAPAVGEIRCDGERVELGGLDRYRQRFSAVFSDFHLFADLAGRDGQDLDESARRLLRELQLDHKVEIAGGRLSTTALSQGQRKRLALLAAYLEDRPLCLFDEWAADQDPYFKEVFYRHLLPGLKAAGKTVLVISHDDRYFDVADRIVRLDEGRVVFDGPVRDAAELRAAMLADVAPAIALEAP